MRIDETCDQQKWLEGISVTISTPLIPIVEPTDDSGCDQRVAGETAIREEPSVRLRPNPARKAKWVERVRIEVAIDVVMKYLAISSVRRKRFSIVVEQVGVGDVPFPVVVGVIAGRSEPMTESGYLAFP